MRGLAVGTPAGMLADRVSPARLLSGSLMLSALVTLGLLVAETIPALPPLDSPTPAVAEARAPDLAAQRVWRDTPFVLPTVLLAVFNLHFYVLELVIPLWVVQQTAAPDWTVAALMLLNTVAVASLQVHTTRRMGTVADAAAGFGRASLLLVLGLTAWAGAAAFGPWSATVVLLVGGALHVLGEMIGSGAQWGVQMGLAPMERQGEYQGFGSMSLGLAGAVAPVVVVWLCVEHGRTGWVVLIAVIATAGQLTPAVARWGLATRGRYGVTTHTG